MLRDQESLNAAFVLEVFRQASSLVFILGVLLAGVAILVTAALVRKLLGNTLRIGRPTLPAFLLLVYLVVMPFPAALWATRLGMQARIAYLFWIAMTPVLVVVGVWLANRLLRDPGARIENFLNGRLGPSESDVGGFLAFVVLLGVALAGLWIYLDSADQVPLLESLRRYGAVKGEVLRHAIYQVPAGIQYVYAFAVRFALPFVLLYSLFIASLYRKGWRIVAAAMGALAIGGSLLTLERSSSLGLFVLLMLAVYWLGGRRAAIWAAGALGVALLVGGLVHRAQYQLSIQAGDLADYMLSFLVSRIFLDPSYMTAVAFQNFAGRDFLWGRSIRLVSVVVGDYRPFSSVGFVGDLWANFGGVGLTVGAIAIGFLTQSVQLVAFRRKTATHSAVFLMMMLNGAWILYGSVLSTMVVTVYLGGIALLAGVETAVRLGGMREATQPGGC